MAKVKQKPLINQQEALSDYFASLLSDADAIDEEVDSIDSDVIGRLEIEREQQALEDWRNQQVNTYHSTARSSDESSPPDKDPQQANTQNDQPQLLENPNPSQRNVATRPMSTQVITPLNFLVPQQTDDPAAENETEDSTPERVIEDVEILARDDNVNIEAGKQMVPILPQAIDNGDTRREIPHWALGYFQCLMFKIAGMNFAAPLDRLNGILEWPENITHLPNQLPWFVGLTRNRGINVQVVDLAAIINAGKPGRLVNLYERAKYIMLIDEGRWGIASDAVADVITLNQDEVLWQFNAAYPWLVGTAKSEMCTLLDTEGFVESLNPNECE